MCKNWSILYVFITDLLSILIKVNSAFLFKFLSACFIFFWINVQSSSNFLTGPLVFFQKFPNPCLLPQGGFRVCSESFLVTRETDWIIFRWVDCARVLWCLFNHVHCQVDARADKPAFFPLTIRNTSTFPLEPKKKRGRYVFKIRFIKLWHT